MQGRKSHRQYDSRHPIRHNIDSLPDITPFILTLAKRRTYHIRGLSNCFSQRNRAVQEVGTVYLKFAQRLMSDQKAGRKNKGPGGRAADIKECPGANNNHRLPIEKYQA
jgi:hypothetical protein